MSVSHRMIAAISMSAMLTLVVPPVVSAQFGGIGRRIKRAATNQAGAEIANKVAGGVRCVFNDVRCAENAKSEGKTPVMTDANGKVITDDSGKPITDPGDGCSQSGGA